MDKLTKLDSPEAFAYRLQSYTGKSGPRRIMLGELTAYFARKSPDAPINIANLGSGMDPISQILLSRLSLGPDTIRQITNYDPCLKTLSAAEEIAKHLGIPASKLTYTGDTRSIPNNSQNACISEDIINFLPDPKALKAHFAEVARILKDGDSIYLARAIYPNNHSNVPENKRFNFYKKDGSPIPEDQAIPGESRMALSYLSPAIYTTLFSRAQIVGAAKESGLTIAQVQATDLPPDLESLMATFQTRGKQAGKIILGSSNGYDHAPHSAVYGFVLTHPEA